MSLEREEIVANHTIVRQREAAHDGILFRGEDGRDHYGSPEGRPIIGRDDEVIGGIDIRSSIEGGEAVVVEPTLLTQEGYDKLVTGYAEIMEDATRTKDPIKDTLNGIYRSVRATMTYDIDAVQKVHPEIDQNSDPAPLPNLRKTNLGDYLIDGIGVCRHMALAAAWLGQTLRDEQPNDHPELAGGKFTSGVNQRNRYYDDREAEMAAHQWMRFESKDGQVYIVDPAQNFVGTLDEAYATAKENPKSRVWEYFRNGEKEQCARRYYADKFGHQAVGQAEKPSNPLDELHVLNTHLDDEYAAIAVEPNSQAAQEFYGKASDALQTAVSLLRQMAAEQPISALQLQGLRSSIIGRITERFEDFGRQLIDRDHMILSADELVDSIADICKRFSTWESAAARPKSLTEVSISKSIVQSLQAARAFKSLAA